MQPFFARIFFFFSDFLRYSHFCVFDSNDSTQSTSNAGDASQSVKEDHRTRFNTKFNGWFASKKQNPSIKSDTNYQEIVNAVQQWASGERFNGDMTVTITDSGSFNLANLIH